MTQPLPALAHDARILDAIHGGAHIQYNLSGGKDSSAAAFAVQAWLDSIGHPSAKRHAIHADLGTIEWRETPRFVEDVAKRLGVPLTVVRRKAGGLITRWRQRWKSSISRYMLLETYQLVSPFSSAKLRFCTSETKVAPIGSYSRSAFAGETVISVIGIRREESPSRAAMPVAKADHRCAPPGNRAGTTILVWHPIIDWSTSNVFGAHDTMDFPLHTAYRMGATRLSCSFCVLASFNDLAVSSQAPGNIDAYRAIVALEAGSGFSFQQGRWLADIAPDLLDGPTRLSIDRAKSHALLRWRQEARLPCDLRFARGWPPRIPTIAEAEIISEVRGAILSSLDITNLYPTAAAVRDRFAELHENRKAA